MHAKQARYFIHKHCLGLFLRSEPDIQIVGSHGKVLARNQMFNLCTSTTAGKLGHRPQVSCHGFPMVSHCPGVAQLSRFKLFPNVSNSSSGTSVLAKGLLSSDLMELSLSWPILES